MRRSPTCEPLRHTTPAKGICPLWNPAVSILPEQASNSDADPRFEIFNVTRPSTGQESTRTPHEQQLNAKEGSMTRIGAGVTEADIDAELRYMARLGWFARNSPAVNRKAALETLTFRRYALKPSSYRAITHATFEQRRAGKAPAEY